MFGINQSELLDGLSNLQERICGYCGPTCDCKYGIEKIKNPIEKMQYNTSEQTGCPEVRQAMAMIQALTNDEFNDLCLKGGMIRTDVLEKALKDKKLK